VALEVFLLLGARRPSPMQSHTLAQRNILPPELLVADNDPRTRELCARACEELKLTVRASHDSEGILDALESGLVDLLVIDETLLGAEFDFLRHIRYWYPESEVIVLAARPTFGAAVHAIKLGAFDYLPKPLESGHLRHTIERAMEQAHQGSALNVPGNTPDYGIVGETPVMQKLYKIIGKVAANVHPVLILGESGTGKELVARAIHFHGTRRDRPFIPVDCGTLVPSLMESELFGHEKGAFTGAERSKDGLLKIAQGGTVFFDEIGELPLELQAKLLRAVQEKEIRPVGSTRRIPIDVRVIAATNLDLESAVQNGTFRTDLYFRLNVVTLKLPPLRDRMDDLELLVNAFLDRIAKNTGQPRKHLSREAVRVLMTYSWPGNVRELENFIERAVALGSSQTLQPLDFPTQLSVRMPPVLESNREQRSRRKVVPIAEVERHAILSAVEEAKGDKLLAAKMLGIGKTTLYRKLQKYERLSAKVPEPSPSPL